MIDRLQSFLDSDPLAARPAPNVLIPARSKSWRRGDRSLSVADGVVASVAQNLIELALADGSRPHGHLSESRLLLLFTSGAKADADGRIELGRASKASPLVRVIGDEADFVIKINGDQWQDSTNEEMVWLLDHELSHCGYAVAAKYVSAKRLEAFVKELKDDHIETCDDIRDKGGRIYVRFVKREPLIDGQVIRPPSSGKKQGLSPRCWRIRKHDVEDFADVIGRWGLEGRTVRYLRDELADEASDLPLFNVPALATAAG